MSHGEHSDHERRLRLVRDLRLDMQRPIAVLADLQAPSICTRRLQYNTPVTLVPGEQMCISTRDIPAGTKELVGTTYPNLHKDVHAGINILINDGKLNLKVLSVDDQDIHCKIIVGDELSNNKGINLPDASITAPPLMGFAQ